MNIGANAYGSRVGHRACHDSIGRQLQNKRSPTGKHKKPNDRSLVWFDKLHRHGPLPSSYLHAYTEHLCRNAAWARWVLADLFHEDGVHGEPYLDRPWQQFDTMDARYHDLVYDLTDAGRDALADAPPSQRERGGSWRPVGTPPHGRRASPRVNRTGGGRPRRHPLRIPLAPFPPPAFAVIRPDARSLGTGRCPAARPVQFQDRATFAAGWGVDCRRRRARPSA